MIHRATIVGVCLLTAGCASPGAQTPIAEPVWISLFDGQTLGRWASTSFGGEGRVEVEEGAIVLPMGSPMTGITWQGEPPARIDYEIELTAMRTLGNDFFCALTFPVHEDACTLVASGWGGAVVGLSSLDGEDASSNETTTFMSFRNDQWYRIRLRVEAHRVQAWVDDQSLIDVGITGKRLSVRPEVEPSRPLGIAAWNSEGRIRDIRWRPLPGKPQAP
jgi:hypothetical protein